MMHSAAILQSQVTDLQKANEAASRRRKRQKANSASRKLNKGREIRNSVGLVALPLFVAKKACIGQARVCPKVVPIVLIYKSYFQSNVPRQW